MEKIVIFGANGRVGICAVKAALEKGLNVRAFFRDLSKFPENLRGKVEIHQGDVLNYKDVSKAIKGVSAAVVILGPKDYRVVTTVMSDGMSNIVKAMKEHGVERVSVCSSATLFWKLEEVPPLFKELDADHRRQLKVLKGSNLKYIALLPGYIWDRQRTDFLVKIDECPGDMISRNTLSSFLVDCLSMPEYYGKSCGIADVEPQKSQ